MNFDPYQLDLCQYLICARIAYVGRAAPLVLDDFMQGRILPSKWPINIITYSNPLLCAEVYKVLYIRDTLHPCRAHVRVFTIIHFLRARANIHTGKHYVYCNRGNSGLENSYWPIPRFVCSIETPIPRDSCFYTTYKPRELVSDILV